MSIMEKNLPIASELAEGDYLRIVTSGGNSKQVLASAVGSAVEQFVVTITVDEDDDTIITSDKTGMEIFAEIASEKQMVTLMGGVMLPYTMFYLSASNLVILYVNIITTTNTMTVREVVIPGNSTSGTATTYSYTLTPTP